jgi:phosphoribosylanthranilate isomerase
VVRVKICGITTIEDALCATDAGTDAIGFVFAPSPRQVSADQACAIREQVPPFVSVVGIFVDPDPKQTMHIFEDVGLDRIQLSGGDERRFLDISGLSPKRLITTVHIGSERDLSAIETTSAGAILLDTKVEGKAGGTGKTFDWDIAAAAKAYGKKIILSGGLNPENVRRAIEIASPHAVDVSSGVESAPGRKDPAKVREFIRRAKENAT